MKNLVPKVNDFIRWNYRFGETYNFLVEQDIPNLDKQPAVRELPEINNMLEQPYIDAFYTLCNSRQFATGGIAKIPISEILIYWSYFELGELEDFLYIIRNADDSYVTTWYDDPANKPTDNSPDEPKQ